MRLAASEKLEIIHLLIPLLMVSFAEKGSYEADSPI